MKRAKTMKMKTTRKMVIGMITMLIIIFPLIATAKAEATNRTGLPRTHSTPAHLRKQVDGSTVR